MANRIKIRHGSGTPKAGTDLLPYELGWDGTSLYINNNQSSGANALIIGGAGLVNDYLPLTGGTISGTLILSKTQDASGTSNNNPALIIGGTQTQEHIEIDGNEILAKSNDTTPSILYLQDSTGTVQVGGSGGFKVPNGASILQNITIGGSTSTLKSTISSSSTLYLNSASSTSIIFEQGGTDKFRLDTSNCLRPETANGISLGSSTKPWGDIYSCNIFVSRAGDTYVKCNNTNKGTAVYLDCDNDRHGIYSSGYNNGTSFVSSAAWLIARGSDGRISFGPYITNLYVNGVISSEDGYFNYNLAKWYGGDSTTTTGTIKIKLPATNSTPTMIMLEIDIYEYNSECGTKIFASGYTYNNGTWYNANAVCLGKFSKNIRFGFDGTNYCILLGATNSTWPYTTVLVKCAEPTYANMTDWRSGYSISKITSETGITTMSSFSGAHPVVTDSANTSRKIYVTTPASVPSGAVTGDIVLVKV